MTWGSVRRVKARRLSATTAPHDGRARERAAAGRPRGGGHRSSSRDPTYRPTPRRKSESWSVWYRVLVMTQANCPLLVRRLGRRLPSHRRLPLPFSSYLASGGQGLTEAGGDRETEGGERGLIDPIFSLRLYIKGREVDGTGQVKGTSLRPESPDCSSRSASSSYQLISPSHSMATAAASVAIQCNSSLRSSVHGMDVGGRAVDGRCAPLRLIRRPCSSVAAKRSPTSAILAAISPAPPATGGITQSSIISVCPDPFAPRSVVGADRPRRAATDDRQRKDEGTGRGEPVSPEKLDEWMRESVCEIVRNIGEAPFLVHVFSSNEGPAGLRLEREPADADSWPRIRGRWSTGAAFPPDGVILVEELKDGGGGEEDAAAAAAAASWNGGGGGGAPSSSSSSSSSKTWGVLVQGRGGDGGAACYILNTCRVRSSFGFCTHFCLARAKCFGDTADVQLRKAWMLGRQHQHQHQHQHPR